MGDWPSHNGALAATLGGVGVWHPLSLGPGYRAALNNAAPLSTAWPAANRALLVPFRLPVLATAHQIVVGCGATGGGNFDAGIYDWYGNRLVSGGTTAQTAASEVVVNITDTVLGPGRYYMALAVDGTTNMTAWTSANAYAPKLFGVRQATSAFVLPATVTFETVAAGVVPSLSVWFRSE